MGGKLPTRPPPVATTIQISAHAMRSRYSYRPPRWYLVFLSPPLFLRNISSHKTLSAPKASQQAGTTTTTTYHTVFNEDTQLYATINKHTQSLYTLRSYHSDRPTPHKLGSTTLATTPAQHHCTSLPQDQEITTSRQSSSTYQANQLIMSALWTREAILQAQEAHKTFMLDGEWIAVYLMIGSIFLVALLGWIKKDPDYTALGIAVFCLFAFTCDPTLVLLTYFSPPTWLTLGHRVGGFAPTSCEISKRIWGPYAWPCQALEFKVWLSNVAGPDGWEYLIRPKLDWLTYLFAVFMVISMLTFILHLPAIFAQQAEEARQRRQRDEQERQWDIERGIARGIEEWKASAKGYTDEKSKLH